jgi:hypothetical protein
MRTLEEYFKDCAEDKICDFAIRANVYDNKTTFYIHPASVGGDTIDFILKGNTLITTIDTKTIGEI